MTIIAIPFWVNSNAFSQKRKPPQQQKKTKKQNQTEKEMSSLLAEVLNAKDIYTRGQCISIPEGLETKSHGKEWYFLLITLDR